MLKKYVKISLDGSGAYIIEPPDLQEAIKNEVGDLEDMEVGTIFQIEIIEMEESEYDKMEEFSGW